VCIGRAAAFLCSKEDGIVVNQIRNWDWQGRDLIGVPDEPYSIMLGLGGELCYGMDLVFPQFKEFPGFELK